MPKKPEDKGFTMDFFVVGLKTRHAQHPSNQAAGRDGRDGRDSRRYISASDPSAFGLGGHLLAQDGMLCRMCELPYAEWSALEKCLGRPDAHAQA